MNAWNEGGGTRIGPTQTWEVCYSNIKPEWKYLVSILTLYTNRRKVFAQQEF